MVYRRIAAGITAFITMFAFVPALYAEDGSVNTGESIISKLNTEDIVVPAGHLSEINLYPEKAIDCKLVIQNSDIAAFGSNGDSVSVDSFSGCFYAKEPGETECTVYIDGEEAANIRITVVPTEFQTLELAESTVKTVSALRIVNNMDYASLIYNSDGNLWLYQDGVYELIAENVDKYKYYEDGKADVFYTVSKDGKLFVNGEEILMIFDKVSEIYVNRYGVYSLTEKNELWFTGYENGQTKTVQLTDECVFFDLNAEFYSTSDNNCFHVEHIKDEKTGKYSVLKYGFGKHIIKETARFNYLLDTDGVLWYVTSNGTSGSKAAVIAEGVADIGEVYLKNEYNNGAFTSLTNLVTPGFIDENGTMFRILAGKITQVEEQEKYELRDETIFSGTIYETEPDYLVYNNYDKIPELFEDKLVPNKYKTMNARMDENGNTFFSFCGYYTAVSDTEKICGAFADGRDYIVLIIRSDGSLWEYHIAQNKFVRKNFGEIIPEKSHDFTAESFIKIIKYMNGEDDETPAECDINEDGVVNITDVVLLKNLILNNR